MSKIVLAVVTMFAVTTFAMAFHRSSLLPSRLSKSLSMSYSIPDQPKRVANAKANNNERFLNIDSVYDPSFLKNKVVLVTGGNRGLGLAITKELISQGAEVIITTRQKVKPDDFPGLHKNVVDIDVTDNSLGSKLVDQLKSEKKIDILINNAGYFYEPVETLSSLNFEEQMKMIDICALGPLRVTAALVNANMLAPNAKVAMITSQGGSIEWRFTQNPNGYDYGHHMSKAAANMMSVLLAQELREKGICVGILHPGFNKTDMTKKYEKIWEVEGAVDPSIGAKRVCHEIGLLSMEKTGKFINCEDGLEIPY